MIPVVTANTAGLLEFDTTLTISGIGFDTNTANDSVSFDNGVTGSVIAATSTSPTVGSLTGLSSLANNTVLIATVTVDSEPSSFRRGSGECG